MHDGDGSLKTRGSIRPRLCTASCTQQAPGRNYIPMRGLCTVRHIMMDHFLSPPPTNTQNIESLSRTHTLSVCPDLYLPFSRSPLLARASSLFLSPSRSHSSLFPYVCLFLLPSVKLFIISMIFDRFVQSLSP